MPELWIPGVPRVEGEGVGIGLQGDTLDLFTWHSFEAPYTYSPDGIAAARYLNMQRSTSHFVLHPITGALVQLLPMNVGARTLKAAGPTTHTNAFGRVHGQVEVIAYALRPFTMDLTPEGLASLTTLMNFLREWGIEDQWAWPEQAPPPFPGGSVPRIQPIQSGHAYHAGWPVNDHGDPGAIQAPWLAIDKEAPPMTLQQFPAASAIQTNAFWTQIERVFKQMGYNVYCGPSYVQRGFCAPGKHPHGSGSRHFSARALDIGFDPASGIAESDYERAFLDAAVRMLRARYPRMGVVWNRGPGDHRDHAHIDDQNYGMEGVYTNKPLPNGIVGFGETGAHVRTIQNNLNKHGAGLVTDGIFGLGTFDAVRVFQSRNGLVPDGLVGNATNAKLVVEVAPKPEPTPPAPTLAERIKPFRIAGSNGFATAVALRKAVLPAGKGVILAVRDSSDHVQAGVKASRRSDVEVIPVRSTGIPSEIRADLASIKPAWIRIAGGPVAIPDIVAYAAFTASGVHLP